LLALLLVCLFGGVAIQLVGQIRVVAFGIARMFVACDLVLTFSVASVNFSSELAHVVDISRFSDASHIIFDMVWKAFIELVSEGMLSPAETSSDWIEFDHVLGDTVIFAHPELLEFGFGFSLRVMRAKVLLELIGEDNPTINPSQSKSDWINNIGFKGDSLEVRQGIVDLCFIVLEHLGAVLEVEFQLDHKHSEFARVRAIKLIRLSDSGQSIRGLTSGLGKESNGACQVVLIIVIVVIGVGIFRFFWIIVWVLWIVISTVWTIRVTGGITIGYTLCLDLTSWKWKWMFVSASLDSCLGCSHSHEVGFECMKSSVQKYCQMLNWSWITVMEIIWR
jgi:hypothetical protein